MRRKEVDDLLKSFRSVRGQEQITPVDKSVNNKVKKSSTDSRVTQRPNSSGKYQSFCEKYHNLELRIDSFTPQDLMYFFREKSKDNGFRYVIANMKRDVGVYKKVLQGYSVREVCLMIEFIFESNQDYIAKEFVQPTILSHSICNRIFNDAMLWVDDKYFPGKGLSRKSTSSTRSWESETPTKTTKIGE